MHGRAVFVALVIGFCVSLQETKEGSEEADPFDEYFNDQFLFTCLCMGELHLIELKTTRKTLAKGF